MPLPGLHYKEVDVAARSAIFRSCSGVRVFGSRANGIARRSSDLDLAISSPEATPAEWAELCDALENTPIKYLTSHVLNKLPMSDSRQKLRTKAYRFTEKTENLRYKYL
jgi:predicted nucleotidyltransferase